MDEKKVHIVGVGPGSREHITACAERVIRESEVLIGARRNLAIFSQTQKECVEISSNLKELSDYIEKNAGKKSVAVLATGDPGIFSISGYIKRSLPDIAVEIVPGISSLQYLCGKAGVTWNDMAIISLHGREDSRLNGLVRTNRKTAVFTGGGVTPAEVCRRLIRDGMENVVVTVGERLSYPEERIVTGRAGEIAGMSFDSLSLMIVQKDADSSPCIWSCKTPGIPDEMFIRGSVPMTKEEVRAASISKLRLEKDSVVYDIGAGTGSVSVECGIICSSGKVYAIERDAGALDLIRANIDKFGVSSVEVVEGEAPGSMEGLQLPDRIFIGGTGGGMDKILEWIDRKVGNVRVVINAISPETVAEALENFEKLGFSGVDLCCISVSRGCRAGKKHIMKALNPVYIISAEKKAL